MTPEERRVRIEVASEILEQAILDFLSEHSHTTFNTAKVSRSVGPDDSAAHYYMCYGALLRLQKQGKAVDHRPSSSHDRMWMVA